MVSSLPSIGRATLARRLLAAELFHVVCEDRIQHGGDLEMTFTNH